MPGNSGQAYTVPRTLRRVVSAVGPWQIILAASAIRQQSRTLRGTSEDYLLLYGYGLSERARETMVRIARCVWDWRRIEWVGDIVEPPDMPFGTCSSLASSALQDRIGVSDADEVWVCKLHATPERVAMEAFRRAAVVFYEDGLGTYQPETFLPSLVLHPMELARYMRWLLRPARRGRRRPPSPCFRIPRDSLRRLTRVHMLPLDLPIPAHLRQANLVPTERETVLSVINATVKEIGIDESTAQHPAGHKLALIMGQPLSGCWLMSWEEELDMYVHVARAVEHAGLTPLWKEHPRASPPFLDELVLRVPSVKPCSFYDDHTWPVELFAKSLRPSCCISALSSSLFYVRYLFGIPTYTFIQEAKRRQWRGNWPQLAGLVEQHIPSVRFLARDFASERTAEGQDGSRLSCWQTHRWELVRVSTKSR